MLLTGALNLTIYVVDRCTNIFMLLTDALNLTVFMLLTGALNLTVFMLLTGVLTYLCC